MFEMEVNEDLDENNLDPTSEVHRVGATIEQFGMS